MAEEERSMFVSVLVPTALVALLLPAILGTSQRAETPSPQAASATSQTLASGRYLLGEDLLHGHLNRDWQGQGDPQLPEVDFLIATVPDPVMSRLDYTYDRYLDAIQRAIEVNGYRLDRFDLPWSRPRADLDAQMAYAGSRTPDSRGPEFARNPGVLMYVKRNPGRALLVYLVGETPTSGVNQTALTAALGEVAKLCNWEQARPSGPPSNACGSGTIKLLAPSFSGSRRSLEIALNEWPGRRFLDPEKPFAVMSGTVTGVPEISGLPEGTLQTTALPDTAFLHGILRYLQSALLADCSQIAFLTEGSGFGLNLRLRLEDFANEPGDYLKKCRVLSLTFPLHLAELRAEAERTKTGRAAPAPAVAAGDEHIPLNANAGRVDRSVVGWMSTEEAASSELVLRTLLTTISREKIRYVGLMSTDVRDRLFLAREVRRYSPNTVLFVYGADVLYLHSDYNTPLRGALVVTPYPLFGPNQFWTTPFDGREQRVPFPISTGQGVYNAAVALLGHEDKMLEYGRPFATDGAGRKPALWLTSVGKAEFWPVSLLPFDPALQGPVYATERASTKSLDWPELAAERGLIPELTATVMFALTFISAAIASLVIVTCAHHLRAAKAALAIERGLLTWRTLLGMRRVRDSFKEWAVQRMWLTKDGRFETARWHCVLVLMVTIGSLYALSAGLFLLPLTALHTLSGQSVFELFGRARIAMSFVVIGVLLLVMWAVVRVLVHPVRLYALRHGEGRRLRREDPGAATPSGAPFAGALVSAPLVFGAGTLALSAVLVAYWHYGLAPETQMFLYARTADLGSGLSPMMPLLLVWSTTLLWSVSEWRRLLLTDDLPTRRTADAAQAAPVPFLNFGSGSLRSIAALEEDVRRVMTCQVTKLPSLLLVSGAALLAFSLWRIHQQVPWSIEGRAFDFLFWLVFVAGYWALLTTFVRGLSVWLYLRRLLRHLAHHPLRAAFAPLQKLHGMTLRLDPARSRGTTGVLALTIEHAQGFTTALPADVGSAPQRQDLARHLEVAEAALEASLQQEAERKWLDVCDHRRLAHEGMSDASEIVAQLLEAHYWRKGRRHGQFGNLSALPLAAAPAVLTVAQATSARTDAGGDVRTSATVAIAVAPRQVTTVPVVDGLVATIDPAMLDPAVLASIVSSHTPGGLTPPPATAPSPAQTGRGPVSDTRQAATVGGVQGAVVDERWRQTGELALASRVADFLNHAVALLRHLSLFVTFGLILMLLATASYPFQPRELLLAFNWSVIGTVVVVSMIALVQMSRDPILMDLAGTQGQSLLKPQYLSQVFLYGALPIFSLLGVQFPEAFNRMMPWFTSFLGGR